MHRGKKKGYYRDLLLGDDLRDLHFDKPNEIMGISVPVPAQRAKNRLKCEQLVCWLGHQ